MRKTPDNILAANRECYARNSAKRADAKRLKYASDPEYRKRALEAVRRWRKNNPEKARALDRSKRANKIEQYRGYERKYRAKVSDMMAVLRAEMPELLKEFGL